ncbi:Endoribonuclease Dcr-1 [Echinococcus granulosus]|uniref:Endoribonuclease Dcr-1 n=1 Tax=Echinococcus granulosus TaxID=6210 RepID=W6UZ33_ECHGR|nr:Endoribonuclease Dcr-1 [Echinococcus granulosus]EUB58854.1 Endoribonuclease Dcr-1 [Echinococcus granulosus]
MPRKHLIVRKILENVPPNHFMPRPYYLDLLDSAEARNTIICTDEDVTLQFVAQTLFGDMAIKYPGKCMVIVISDASSVKSAAETFKYVTDTPVLVVADASSKIPTTTEVIFMSAETAANLCSGEEPVFSIHERAFLLILDDCELVLSPGHPYQRLFPYSKDPLSEHQIEDIWNRDPSFYSSTSASYRILALTSTILPVGCSDHLLAKRYICSLEDRLGCRLETTSELINLLSLGAQPEEEEIPAPDTTNNGDNDDQHSIRGTILRLLVEARDFLSDVDFTGSEENVATTGQRVINVPYYCLRSVAQCEAITKDLGVYCGALIARVFLRHLYRLERARASILEARRQLEHGEDLLTRILRYTATQLSMIARLFQTVCDNCMTREEVRTLASPRVLQLVDRLRTLKPTGSYRIEAVWRTEGVSEDTGSDSDAESSGLTSHGSWSSSRRRSRLRGRSTSSGFVAPHGFEAMSGDDDEDDDYGEGYDDSSLFSGVDSVYSEDDNDFKDACYNDSNGKDSADDNDGESGGESDATDVSMGLSSGIRRKSTRKPCWRPHKIRSPVIRGSRGGSRLVYRVLPDNPDKENTVPPLCGLLLVGGCQFSAYALPRFIEEYCNWDPEIAFVRPGYFFVPGASDQVKTLTLSADVGSTQEETVANFRCGGEVNLLVTTQSGLAAASSLPRCNLIALFHPSTSLATYLAAKSRLRLVAVKSTKAHFWHFLESDGFSLRTRFQEMERMLVQRCSNSYLISDEHDVDADYVNEQFTFLPKRKACRAIDVVNHYCARLPCNFMTRLAPRWHLTTRRLAADSRGAVEGGDHTALLTCPDPSHAATASNMIVYRCALQMPINSPVREVVWSEWSLCKKMAKYSAAVRVGQLLMETREIDARGRPILRHTPIAAVAAASRRLRATRERSPPKHKSSYLIKTPDSLVKCLAKEDRGSIGQNRLYLVDIRHLDTALSRLQREHRSQGTSSHIDFFPEAENRGFAMLTTKPLPFIPEFSIFTRSGEETVHIYEASSCPPLNIDQLNRLSRFHRIIFKSVLRFEKDCLLKFNLVDAPCQLLIVPVKRDSQKIDWDLVNLCLNSYVASVGDCRLPVRRRPAPPLQLPTGPVPLTQLLSQTSSPRTVFHFVQDDFVNAVLTPTYRNVEYPPRYYVVAVRNDLSPATEFPSPQYATFADYYACKYGLRLSGAPSDQPLLDAAYAPLRLAPLLVPRGCVAQRKSNNGVASGNATSTSKHVLPRHIQLLVPEFCHRHAMPATGEGFSVWQKAICLPSILYRLQHLLLAEELRSEIARETGLGVVTPPHRFCFPPLRCYFTPQVPSPSPSPSPPPSYKKQRDPEDRDSEPEVVKLTLSPLIQSKPRNPATDFQALLYESDRLESDGEGDLDPEAEEEEEEVDAKSIDSFEENATNMCFFPSEDDDEGEDEKGQIVYKPGPTMILQSLTLLGAGDFINMERLETIGDSFLKFAVTMDLFLRYPEAHEGHLSSLRSQIVGNSNLYRLGCEKNLPGRIVGVAFEPHENWLPPCYVCTTDPTNNIASTRIKNQCPSLTHQFLTNKSVADCVESLVGCYLTERGERSALKLLQWFGIECLPPAGEMQPAGSPWKLAEEKPLSKVEEATVERVYRAGRFSKLEEIIGYTFKNRRLLIEAFTHSTCRDLHGPPSDDDGGFHGSATSISGGYERLEFLGDAVLDYAVTRFLFTTDATARLSPGALTDLRSALVNNVVFGALAVRHGLHAFLRAAAPPLTRTMALFLRHHHDVVRGDLDVLIAPEVNVCRENKGATASQAEGDRANEEVEVPKALGDVFESLAGAVFLDSGLCLNTLWRVFFPLLRERIERYSTCVAKSPVRRLLELCPERVKFERPMVRPDGKMRVVVRVAGIGRYVGVGRTYRLAKSAAADLAYRRVTEASTEQV